MSETIGARETVQVTLPCGLTVEMGRETAREMTEGIENRLEQERNEMAYCLSLAPVLARAH